MKPEESEFSEATDGTSERPLEATEGPQKRRRKRRTGKKRVVFEPPPRFPLGVRELWKSATPEERERAHATCATMLEYWLGRIRKEDAAERLSVPLLRVWQLSQMATAGMLAGLLKQPRPRRKGVLVTSDQSEVNRLRKEVQRLQREKELLESLVALLRSFPGRSGAGESDPPPAKRPKKGAGKKGGGNDSKRGRPPTHRRVDPSASSPTT